MNPPNSLEELRHMAQRLEHAEQQQRQWRMLFDLFLIHAPVVAWIKDAGYRYLFANARCYAMFPDAAPSVGNSREWLGHRDDELFSAATIAAVRPSDEHVLRTGESVEVVLSVPGANGANGAFDRWRAWKFRIDIGDARYIGGVAVPEPGGPHDGN